MMRAMVFETHGTPDVLHLREVPLPEPGRRCEKKPVIGHKRRKDE